MKFDSPEAEILNACAAMLGFVIAVGTYMHHRSTHPRYSDVVT